MLIVPGESNEKSSGGDSFTNVSDVGSDRPSVIEPIVQNLEKSGFDMVNVDRSSDLQSQRDVTSLSMAVQNQFDQTPDQAAKLLKLEMETGLPSQFIQENLAEVERSSKTQGFSVEDFRAKSPKLAAWTAENPNHYSLVKEDLDSFRAIEEQSAFGLGFDTATMQREKSELIRKRWDKSSTPADAKREAELDQLMELQAFRNEGESFSSMLARTGGYTSKQMIDSTKAAAVGAGVGAVLAPFTGGLSIPVAAKIGAASSAALDAYEMESNFAYDEISKTVDSEGNRVSEETAKNVARGIGVINAAIETAGDVLFLRMIPGGDKLLGIATKSTRKNMSELAAKALATPTLAKGLADSAVKMFTGSAGEGATEFVQNLVGGAGKRIATNIEGMQVDSSWGEDLSQGLAEGKEALFGSLVTLGVAHGGANFYQHTKAIRNGEQNARFFEAVAGGVQSKAFQSLPEKGQEAVRAAIAGGGNETTYFQSDAWNSYWQGKGIDPREAASQVAGDGGKSYDQAFDAGGFISIPTDRMGRKLLANGEHQGLMIDATTDPLKETPREAMAAREQLQAEVDAAQKSEIQSVAEQTSAVEDTVYKQLVAAKDPGDARKKAKLFAKINETLSIDAGMSPEAFYEQYGLKINRILPDALQAKTISELDPIIDQLRAGQIPTESEARGQSLTEFLRQKGGINIEGQGADVASFEPDSGSRKFTKKLSRKKGGLNIDRAAEQAWESGFISANDSRELIDAISKDLAGEPVYSDQFTNSNILETREVLNQFSGHLRTLGVDLAAMDNETIKAMIEVNVPAAVDQREDIYLQSRENSRVAQTEFPKPSEVLITTSAISEDKLKAGDTIRSLSAKGWPKSVTNEHTGWKIDISKKGLKESVNKRTPTWALDKLPELLKAAIYEQLGDDIKGDSNIEKVHYLYAPIQVGDKIHAASLMVREVRSAGSTEKKFYLERVSDETRSASLTQSGQSFDGHANETGEPRTISLQDFEGIIKSERNRFPLFQGGAEPRGQIRIGQNRIMNIDLYKSANFSTFLHEQAHYWLEVMGDIAQSETGSDRIKKMYADTLKYLEVSDRSQIGTDQHETFARAFEAYLREGKAPTSVFQPIFNTFKAWLTWVYRSLSQLNVNLSPEITNVFDRMIATDEEIFSAQREQRMDPIILDPVAAGMNDKQAEAYTKLVTEARQEAEQALTVKMMEQIQKERTAIWKAERAEVKAAITAQVDGRADQTLLKILKAGKMDGLAEGDLKLNKQSLIGAYGKEFVERLPKGIFSKEGYSHDSLASILGFDSGWELVQMLANTQDRKALIEQLTNDEMLTRHGDADVYTNGKLHEEALNAVHNDKRAELMRLEMDWLMQQRTKDAKKLLASVARRVPTVAIVREKAESLISKMVTSEIKPHQYLRAERKYSNEALSLVMKGDFDGAFEAKKKALLNHELYRSATNAKENIEKIEGRFNKFYQQDEKLAKTRDMNLIGAGRAILAGFGFGSDERSPEQHLEQMKQYDPEGYALLIDRIEGAIENADYYTNLPYEQFVALSDLVDGLWSQSRSDRQIQIDGVKRDIQEVRDELSQGLTMLPSKVSDGYTRSVSVDEENMNGFQTMRSRVTRIEFKVDSMDAKAGGVFKKFIYNPVREATEIYRAKKGEALQKWNQLVQDHKEFMGGPEIVADEIQAVFKNKAELLGAMQHIGNESNFRKLILGNEWGTVREDGTVDSSNWDSFIERLQREGVLKLADYQFLQGLWDLNDSVKKDTQRAHKEMYGFYFAEITKSKIVTPFGEFQGGYVPASPDKARSRDADVRNEKAQVEGSFASELPQKNDGFTKARVENYSTPLLMDLGQVASHIDNVMRFTYITPRVREVMKVVHNKELRKQFDAYDRTFVSHVVIPFLQRASTQKTTVATENKQMDRFFSFAKNNSAIQLMFLNIPNTVQQVANYIPAALKARPSFLLNAVVKVTTNNKEVTAMVTEKSVFMKNKIDQLAEKAAIETENVLKDRGSFEQASVWFSKNAYVAQTFLQNIMDTQVWLASYDSARADGLNETDSIRHADSAIRETQGSFAPEDTAAVETQTPLMKTLMMFYGFFNNMANLYTSEWNKAGALEGNAKALKRTGVVANYFLFALAGKLSIDAIRGRVGEDDDDKESLEFWMKYTFGSAFELTAPMLGIAGQAAQVGYKNLTGQANYGNRISVSPILGALDQGINAVTKQGGSKSAKTSTKDAMTLIASSPLIGFLPIPKVGVMQKAAGFAAPVGALKRPVGYAIGVSEGVDRADNPIQVGQGLVSGSAKRK